jgi:hypothetical protein
MRLGPAAAVRLSKQHALLENESFAKRKFPGANPVGQRVHVGSTDQPWFTIVGVVGDVKQTSLALGQADAVYIPTVQWPFADRALSLVVRAVEAGPPQHAAALAPAIREAICGKALNTDFRQSAETKSFRNSNASRGRKEHYRH